LNTHQSRHEPGSSKGFDWQILVVFLIALVFRFAYFLTVRNDAYYQVPLLDSAWYHRSALEILREGFWGKEVFFRGPLYSYFVAFWYWLFGENPQGPKVVQLILGAGSAAVLVLALRRVLDGKTAFVSGIIAALYPTLVFFDGELLATGLASFLGVLLLYFVLRADEAGTAAWWVTAGLILGFAALTRPQILLVGVGLGIWLAVDRSHKLRSLIVFVVAAVIVIAPVTVRNAVIGKDFVPIASQGGVNFYMGNNPMADGRSAQLPGWERSRDWTTFEEDARKLAEAETGRVVSPSQESNFWTRKALGFMADHPWQAASLFARKIYLLLNGFEIPNNKDLYFFKGYSPVLNVLLWKHGLAFPAGLLIPLAAVGLVFSRTRPREVLVLHLFLLCQSVAILLFFVCGRFRVAILPVVIPFAVWGVREVLRRVREGPRAPAALACLIGVAFLVLSNSDFLGVSATARWQDYYDLGLVHVEKKEFEKARAAFEEAYRLKSDDVPVLYNLGLAHMSLAEHEEAVPYFRAALEIHPGMHRARNNLAICLGQMGRLEEAEEELQRILKADPDHLEAQANLRVIQQLKERAQ
jgi:4-amino-4-deoxy-L-arabinose transferase-like glycosyltransferase